MKEDEKMKQPTKFMKAYPESHYDQVFNVAAAVAALFGYPAPPAPLTLKSNPEWRAYLRFDVSKNTDGSASEAIEFNKWLGLFFQTCSRAEASAVKGGWRWLLLENAEAPDITCG